ncbi:MAG TPA: DNA polymerase IV [Bacillota bacterium]|jgi:DNA polymerase-4|nr:DNA polymerase IV [Bacillota bacterium]HOL10756.1 DNA polymerase IV [Bacillota bacterium]
MTDWQGRLIFHVDADAFFASVEQRSNPRLIGKPVVVCGLPWEKGVVTAASYEARRYGVKAGIPNFQARKLLPNAYFIPVNIPKYLYYSLKLFAIYLQYSPKVEPYSIDEVFMDMTGTIKNPTVLEVEALAQNIKTKVLRETGLTVSVGIGPNKLVAKVATELMKPNGLTIIGPDNLAKNLALLPVKLCPGIGAKTASLLNDAGIQTFGDLAAVPLFKLRRIFGINGEKFYWAARGIDNTPVLSLEELPPEKSKGHEVTLAQSISSLPEIKGLIWQLADKVAFQLREKHLEATGVRIKVKIDTVKSKLCQCQLTDATSDGSVIAATSFKLLSKTWDGKPLRGLGVYAIGLMKANGGVQLPLFPIDDSKTSDELGRTIDCLKQKYGEGIISTAVNLLVNHLSQNGDQ